MEIVGNTLQSKYIPYIATSLSLTIILKFIKELGKEKIILGLTISTDLIVLISIAIPGIYFMAKSFNYRDIDKLEFLLKNMASFVEVKQNETT